MAWSYLQVEQRPASKNSVAMNNERTEGCCFMMGHSSKESPRQRGSGEILYEYYVPHDMKRISKQLMKI